MTAETLKPFIKVPVEVPIVREKTRNRALVCHTIVLAIFYAGLLGFVVWNSVRVANLQKEVKYLNKLVDSMQKRLGLDLLDDLDEFEEAYGNPVSPDKVIPDKQWYETNENEENYIDGLDDIDDDESDKDGIEEYTSDELDYGTSSEEEDLLRALNDTSLEDSMYDDIIGAFDDDYEYKTEKESNESEEDIGERKTRSITSRSGVPIIEQPYLGTINKSATPGGVEPTMKYDWKERKEQYLERKHKKYMESRSKPASIVRKRDHSEGDEANNQVSQQDKTSSHPAQIVLAGTRRRVVRPIHKSLEGRGRQRTVAVHYIGDTSRYIPGQHKHYEGNGRLRHSGGVYVDWAVDPSISNVDQYFHIENGVVTVNENGIYLLYAQIFYHDDHDTNGFRVERNGTPFLLCTSMTHSRERVTKSNTCFTSGITHLRSGDKIHISDLAYDRHVILDPIRSFFGLVKIGAAGPAHHTQRRVHHMPADDDRTPATRASEEVRF